MLQINVKGKFDFINDQSLTFEKMENHGCILRKVFGVGNNLLYQCFFRYIAKNINHFRVYFLIKKSYFLHLTFNQRKELLQLEVHFFSQSYVFNRNMRFTSHADRYKFMVITFMFTSDA